MTVKVFFNPDGIIYCIEFLGQELSAIGEVPLVVRGKLEIITIDLIDLENLIDFLNSL